MVLVEKQTREGGPKTLCGFFPFMEYRNRLGMKHWVAWKHPLIFLTTPLVMRGMETEVWQAVWAELKNCDSPPWWAGFPLLGEMGASHIGHVESLRDDLRTTFTVDRFPRAMITFPSDPEQYLKQNVDGHHLREMRRLRRKLEQSGQLEYRSLQDPQHAGAWSDWFLDLEANGWKATTGTAMKQSPAHSQFFRDIVRGGMQRGQLKLEGLFLNGEPIALKCNLHQQPATFAFKIAYREDLKKFSPGIQLELESLERYSADPSITWSDSCAIPKHGMIERLWSERRIIHHTLISSGTPGSELCLASLPAARVCKRLGQRLRRRATASLSAQRPQGN